jgi:hypothetical protein
LGAFFAIAEKKIESAGGAKVADKDVLFAEAGVEELGAVGLAKIEEDILGGQLVARRHHGEPLERVGLVAGAKFVEPFGSVGKLGEEGGGDLRADFVATTADSGAENGEQIRRSGAKLHVHAADGFHGDTLQSATPSGVNGSDGALIGIDEKNWNTVGGLDAQEKARPVCDGSVTAAGTRRRDFEHVNDVRVELFQGDKSKIPCTESRLEKTAIFQDVFAGVPFREAEIENVLDFFMRDRRVPDQRADAAGPHAETVHQPGKFV